MLTKNQIIDLTITAMSAEGNGIGRAEDGMTVFVPFTAVGDVIRCRVVKVQKTLFYRRSVRPSPFELCHHF